MKTVIEMAKEAGSFIEIESIDYIRFIKRFADIIREDEREACAKVCEEQYNSPDFNEAYVDCADAIRARS